MLSPLTNPFNFISRTSLTYPAWSESMHDFRQQHSVWWTSIHRSRPWVQGWPTWRPLESRTRKKKIWEMKQHPRCRQCLRDVCTSFRRNIGDIEVGGLPLMRCGPGESIDERRDSVGPDAYQGCWRAVFGRRQVIVSRSFEHSRCREGVCRTSIYRVDAYGRCQWMEVCVLRPGQRGHLWEIFSGRQSIVSRSFGLRPTWTGWESMRQETTNIPDIERAFGGRWYIVSTHMGDVEEWMPAPVVLWAMWTPMRDVNDWGVANVDRSRNYEAERTNSPDVERALGGRWYIVSTPPEDVEEGGTF